MELMDHPISRVVWNTFSRSDEIIVDSSVRVGEGKDVERFEKSGYDQCEISKKDDYFRYEVTTHLYDEFVKQIKELSKVKKVFWAFEADYLRVWTVIDGPNEEVQEKIYQAELEFMDTFPKITCDFVVLFQPNDECAVVRPQSAYQVYPFPV
jgi:hypothetical protein